MDELNYEYYLPNRLKKKQNLFLNFRILNMQTKHIRAETAHRARKRYGM